MAAAGHGLYPLWWWLGPGLGAFGSILVAIIACLRGRSRTQGRVVVVVICAVSFLLTAVATADTVTRTGTAIQPLVTGLVALVGLMDRPAIALPFGVGLVGSEIVGMAVTRPLDPADAVLVGFIQLAILAAATVGGQLARRGAAAQDRDHARLTSALHVVLERSPLC